jgi:protein-tyrosine phosphatase
VLEVPDPYYGNAKGFELVLDMIEDACAELLAHMQANYLPASGSEDTTDE